LDPTLFKAILIDEAHHAVADSYLNILNYFNNPQLLVWGCSATVKRHDGLSLSDVFDKITFHIDFLDLIERGYLSPMKVTTVKTSVDLSHVRHSGADFALTQLSQAVNTSVRNEVIVSSWRKYAAETGRQSTLAFAVDIQHTQDLCNAFRQQGIKADFITSKTPDLTRHQILEDFKNRKIPVLINCGRFKQVVCCVHIDSFFFKFSYSDRRNGYSIDRLHFNGKTYTISHFISTNVWKRLKITSRKTGLFDYRLCR
jgi:ATP-dependent helicase IRC3